MRKKPTEESTLTALGIFPLDPSLICFCAEMALLSKWGSDVHSCRVTHDAE